MRTQPLLFWILRITTGFFCWCLAFFLLKYLFPLTLLIKHWLENYGLQHSSGLTNGRLVVIIHLSTLLTSLLVLLPSYPSYPILGNWERVVVQIVPWGSFPIPEPIHTHQEVFMGVVFGSCLLLWVLHTCLCWGSSFCQGELLHIHIAGFSVPSARALEMEGINTQEH